MQSITYHSSFYLLSLFANNQCVDERYKWRAHHLWVCPNVAMYPQPWLPHTYVAFTCACFAPWCCWRHQKVPCWLLHADRLCRLKTQIQPNDCTAFPAGWGISSLQCAILLQYGPFTRAGTCGNTCISIAPWQLQQVCAVWRLHSGLQAQSGSRSWISLWDTFKVPVFLDTSNPLYWREFQGNFLVKQNLKDWHTFNVQVSHCYMLQEVEYCST